MQLEEIKKEKRSIEDKSSKFKKEKADLTTQLEENEEELQEVITKYKASVSAVSADQMTIQNQTATIQELEFERNKLKDQYAEISKRLDQMGKEGENVNSAQQQSALLGQVNTFCLPNPKSSWTETTIKQSPSQPNTNPIEASKWKPTRAVHSEHQPAYGHV